MSACKWLSDDDQKICYCIDCPVCADLCPLTAYPFVCWYFEEARDE